MAKPSRRVFLTSVPAFVACAPQGTRKTEVPPQAAQPRQRANAVEPSNSIVPGLAIHGGAGKIPRDWAPAKVEAYKSSLQRALLIGQDALAKGQDALDVVERVIRFLEDDPRFNAGKGAVLTANKTHELDASIMCGRTSRCGAVAGVTTVRHPISLARKVMDETRHVLLAGQGAEAFASVVGVERVEPSYFLAPGRVEAYEKAKARYEQGSSALADDEKKGTVGAVVLDQKGNLAAGTSTGGLTYKQYGRVGDSPIVGAGTFANNQTCAVSCTGTGEEYIRNAVAHEVSARMRLAGESVEQAASHVIHQVLQPGDGGLIALDHRGNIAMPFNTSAMFRGSVRLQGAPRVGVWE